MGLVSQICIVLVFFTKVLLFCTNMLASSNFYFQMIILNKHNKYRNNNTKAVQHYDTDI